MSLRRFIAIVLSITALGLVAGACSSGNREGPDVTCEDLACGRINACQDGIIAQCVDGVVMRFRVCSFDTICEQEWQIPGQYACAETDTDCEGCRPERVEGCDWIDPLQQVEGGAGGTGGLGAGGSGGGTVS